MSTAKDFGAEPPVPRRVNRELFERTTTILGKAVDRLWAGNGAGLVLSITMAAAAYKEKIPVPREAFLSPALFAGGLMALLIGTAVSIAYNSGRLTVARDDPSWPEQLLSAREAGLGFFNAETFGALVAALLFAAGCLNGLNTAYLTLAK